MYVMQRFINSYVFRVQNMDWHVVKFEHEDNMELGASSDCTFNIFVLVTMSE